MSNLKIYIEREYATRTISVFVEEKKGVDIVFLGSNERGKIIEQKTSEYLNDKIVPLITLPSFLFDMLAKELVSELNKEGVKTKDHSLMEGKLEAKQEHLEDLKTILFKQLKIEK